MKVWGLSHGADGWSVHIDVVPWWVLALDHAQGSTLELLGHPCCHFQSCGEMCWPGCENEHRRTWVGWITDHLPKRKWWKVSYGEYDQVDAADVVSVWQFSLSNNWLTTFVHKRTQYGPRLPVDRDTAHKINPTFVEQMESLDSDAQY